jgi:hypothetical protein
MPDRKVVSSNKNYIIYYVSAGLTKRDRQYTYEKNAVPTDYKKHEQLYPLQPKLKNTITTIIPSDHFMIFNSYDVNNTQIDSITRYSLN